jgi:hypothetical protein
MKEGFKCSKNNFNKLLKNPVYYGNIEVIRQNIMNGWPVNASGYATRTAVLNIYFYSDGHDWVIDG